MAPWNVRPRRLVMLVALILGILAPSAAGATPELVAFGVVRDTDGTPTAGVCIDIWTASDNEGTTEELMIHAVTVTDPLGAYTVDRAHLEAPDIGFVHAIKLRFRDCRPDASLAFAWHPDHVNEDDAPWYDASLAHELDATLEPAAVIEGSVTTTDGEPLDAQITVHDGTEQIFFPGADDDFLAFAHVTATGGHFRLGGLASKAYELTFRCCPGGPAFIPQARAIDLAPAERITLDVTLVEYGYLEGTMGPLPRYGTTLGLPDWAEVPYWGRRDVVTAFDGLSQPVRTVWVDPQTGRWRMPVEPGTYLVRFAWTRNGGITDVLLPWPASLVIAIAGLETHVLERWWEDAPTSALATPVTLDEGQTISGLDAAFVPPER